MNNDKRCTCGDTTVSYHPDENQHEPNCWDCYYQKQEAAEVEDMEEHTIYPEPENNEHKYSTEVQDDLPF